MRDERRDREIGVFIEVFRGLFEFQRKRAKASSPDSLSASFPLRTPRTANSGPKFPLVSKGFAGFELTPETGQSRQNPTFPVSVSFHINLPSAGKY